MELELDQDDPSLPIRRVWGPFARSRFTQLLEDLPDQSVGQAHNNEKAQHHDGVYQYEPLPDDSSIRLLSILPSVDFDSDLTCTMSVVSLSGNERYEALSYSWGEDTTLRTNHIICNGQLMRVTLNLFEALRRLRHRRKKRVIWVDFACICQSDPKERTEQVGKMSQIFGSAWRTIIWLGEDSPQRHGEIAIRCLRTLADPRSLPKQDPEESGLRQLEWFRQLELFKRAWRCSTASCPVDEKLEKRAKNAYVIRDAMHWLSGRRWFSRRWIIQELYWSNIVDVTVGTLTISWKSFAAGMERAWEGQHLDEYNPPYQTDGYTAVHDNRKVRATLRLIKWRHARYARLPTDSFFRMLQDFDDFDCSDAIDRLYCLSNMLTVGDGELGRPDYESTVEGAYAVFAHDAVQRGFAAHVLRNAARRARGVAGARPFCMPDSHRPILDHTPQPLPVWVSSWRHAIRDPLGDRTSALPTWVPDWRIQLHSADRFSPDLGHLEPTRGTEKSCVDWRGIMTYRCRILGTIWKDGKGVRSTIHLGQHQRAFLRELKESCRKRSTEPGDLICGLGIVPNPYTLYQLPPSYEAVLLRIVDKEDRLYKVVDYCRLYWSRVLLDQIEGMHELQAVRIT